MKNSKGVKKTDDSLLPSGLLSPKKAELGQFYTTNYEYIFKSFIIPDNIKKIIEPFAGNGDLVKYIESFGKSYELECYDIDPKREYIKIRDTLKDPPNYKDAYVITNPPYLARNKCANKELFDKYETNDLYKCFIEILIKSDVEGGMIIIPLNFFSSMRKSDIDLRRRFVERFTILLVNIFEERVFDDTSYTVCSFQFVQKKEAHKKIKAHIYPSKSEILFELNEGNDYTIGGEVYHLKQSGVYKVERATRNNKTSSYMTSILVKCIDDNINSKIQLKIVDEKDRYIDLTPELSARSYATLVIEPKLSKEEEETLVYKFNEYLDKKRTEYNSLFLTNYRESNSIARKRISFTLVFEICSYILSEMKG